MRSGATLSHFRWSNWGAPGGSTGAQFQAHVGQMVERSMFAQFPELEPAERKRRRQEQERQQQQQQQQRAQQRSHSSAEVGPSTVRPDEVVGSPRYLSAC